MLNVAAQPPLGVKAPGFFDQLLFPSLSLRQTAARICFPHCGRGRVIRGIDYLRRLPRFQAALYLLRLKPSHDGLTVSASSDRRQR